MMTGKIFASLQRLSEAGNVKAVLFLKAIDLGSSELRCSMEKFSDRLVFAPMKMKQLGTKLAKVRASETLLISFHAFQVARLNFLPDERKSRIYTRDIRSKVIFDADYQSRQTVCT